MHSDTFILNAAGYMWDIDQLQDRVYYLVRHLWFLASEAEPEILPDMLTLIKTLEKLTYLLTLYKISLEYKAEDKQ